MGTNVTSVALLTCCSWVSLLPNPLHQQLALSRQSKNSFPKQDCRAATACLAPGLQVSPPDSLASVPDDVQPSESLTPPSHLHRTQSITSAVDYEYFDMGIGQVPHTPTHEYVCSGGSVAYRCNASVSCFSPPPPACLDRPMEA